MKNLAIIPARSGSKGVKDKNIKQLNGVPLLAYSIKSAEESGLFDEIMVSTDSDKYAKIAIEYGANVPFLRSKELSNDVANSWDVVKEVLNQYRQQERLFDTVCLLQPTSPLRDAKDIQMGYETLIVRGADAVTSVCEVEHSPLWTMALPSDNSLHEFRRGLKNEKPRQQLDTYYRLNGAIYIRKVDYGENVIEIPAAKEYAVIMKQENSVDIDTELDFIIAEKLMKKHLA